MQAPSCRCSNVVLLPMLAELAENITLDYKKHEAEDLKVPPEELAAEHTTVRIA